MRIINHNIKCSDNMVETFKEGKKLEKIKIKSNNVFFLLECWINKF